MDGVRTPHRCSGQTSHRSNPINGRGLNAARTLHGNIGKGAFLGEEVALADAGRAGEKSDASGPGQPF